MPTIPTETEFQLLYNAGFSVLTQLNNVNGRYFGTALYRIFLPAAGFRNTDVGRLTDVGTYGGYWSSTPCDTNTTFAIGLGFRDNSVGVGNGGSANAISIRCVTAN